MEPNKNRFHFNPNNMLNNSHFNNNLHNYLLNIRNNQLNNMQMNSYVANNMNHNQSSSYPQNHHYHYFPDHSCFPYHGYNNIYRRSFNPRELSSLFTSNQSTKSNKVTNSSMPSTSCSNNNGNGNCANRFNKNNGNKLKRNNERKNKTNSTNLLNQGREKSTTYNNSDFINIGSRKIIRKTIFYADNKESKNQNTSVNQKQDPKLLSESKSETFIKINKNKIIRKSYFHEMKERKRKSSIKVLTPNKLIRKTFNEINEEKKEFVNIGNNKIIKRSLLTMTEIRKINKKINKWKKMKNPKNNIFVTLGKNKLVRRSLYKKINLNNKPQSLNTVPMNISSGRKRQMEICYLLQKQKHLEKCIRANSKLISIVERSICKSEGKYEVECPAFRRNGICKMYDADRCDFMHDEKYVSLCKDNLMKKCENTNCKLSHCVTAAKVPICQYYLSGNCTRNDCFYPHYKLSSKDPICEDFLKGFCELAEECKKWHLFICPEYAKSKKCEKGNKCPLPHKNLKHFKTDDVINDQDLQDAANRYFEMNICDSKQTENIQQRKGGSVRNRAKSWSLAEYIPLVSNKS